MNYLTFDIGGTDVKYGVINSSFEIVFKDSFPTQAHLGATYILMEIVKKANELSKYKPVGIAISSGGSINSTTGVVLGATDNIPNYIGINVKEFLETKIKLPTSVLNDVNSVGLAEATFGAGKNFKNALIIAIGTGIGGAIFINNELFEGTHYGAGEFGNMIIEGESWEKTSSTKSLVDIIKTRKNIANGLEIFELYDNKDPFVVEEVNKFYNRLSIGILNLCFAFNPEVIVIGGGISNRKTFIDELNIFLKPLLVNTINENVIVKIAKFKNDAGMIGALIHHLKQQI